MIKHRYLKHRYLKYVPKNIYGKVELKNDLDEDPHYTRFIVEWMDGIKERIAFCPGDDNFSNFMQRRSQLKEVSEDEFLAARIINSLNILSIQVGSMGK